MAIAAEARSEAAMRLNRYILLGIVAVCAVAVLRTLGDTAGEGGGVPERRLARQHLQRGVHDAAARRMQRQPQLSPTQRIAGATGTETTQMGGSRDSTVWEAQKHTLSSMQTHSPTTLFT